MYVKHIKLDLRALDFDGRTLTLDLNSAAHNLGEGGIGELLHQIDMQISDVLAQGEKAGAPDLDYAILIEGEPLFDFQPQVPMRTAASGILDRKVVLNPGHGRYNNNRGEWPLQRSYYWGIVEDYINLDLTIELTHGQVEILEEAAAQLAAHLATYAGVTEIDDGFAAGKAQLDFTLRPEAQSLGLTPDAVGRKIRHALRSETPSFALT